MVEEKKITASDILEALRRKHADDVFVSECKTGATWTSEHRRFDAWVLKKSWSKPNVIGYEIKVSRQDFLKDNKWQDYLGFCNQFYFVCPAGIIRETELPKEAGLIVITKSGKKLFTKKLSVRRDIEIPAKIYKYIIMCRSEIVTQETKKFDKIEYWQKWLEKKKIGNSLGWIVSETLSKRINEEIVQVKERNNRLDFVNEQLQSTKELLLKMGITDYYTYNLEHRIRTVIEKIPIIEHLRNVIFYSTKAKEKIEELIKTGGNKDESNIKKTE